MELAKTSVDAASDAMIRAFAEASASCAELVKQLEELGRSTREVSEMMRLSFRAFMVDEYGRLPVLQALRLIAEESNGRPFSPRTIRFWLQTQIDLLPSLD